MQQTQFCRGRRTTILSAIFLEHSSSILAASLRMPLTSEMRSPSWTCLLGCSWFHASMRPSLATLVTTNMSQSSSTNMPRRSLVLASTLTVICPCQLDLASPDGRTERASSGLDTSPPSILQAKPRPVPGASSPSCGLLQQKLSIMMLNAGGGSSGLLCCASSLRSTLSLGDCPARRGDALFSTLVPTLLLQPAELHREAPSPMPGSSGST
mmetsp:Transcript_60388/g.155639  ORF Transcript_60388/g.155639 Transcript_60388/m.155639 type:complete len:211 (+) Transcript_60388:98-730(+)